MSEFFPVTVDGRQVMAPAGSTLKEAAELAGVDIPTVCHTVRFATGANCRVCVVEVAGSRTLVPACDRRVEPYMEVQTDSERVRRSRRVVLELLLAQADLSASPEALAYAEYYGAEPERWADPEDGPPDAGTGVKRDNPFFLRDYDRCILCQKCTEACGAGIQYTFAIAVTGRGHEATIGTGGTGLLPDSPCVFCGNCVEVCPTGALMPLYEAEARERGEWRQPVLRWSPATGFEEVEG